MKKFTVIEVMIVFAILLIIGAIAIPGLMKVQEQNDARKNPRPTPEMPIETIEIAEVLMSDGEIVLVRCGGRVKEHDKVILVKEGNALHCVVNNDPTEAGGHRFGVVLHIYIVGAPNPRLQPR